MNLSELINEILSEWAYRVEDGMPNPKNPTHLKELGFVLSEMGLSHIESVLVENLLMEKGKTPEEVKEADKSFTNPILNKKVTYKDKQGNDKEGIVGNLLRQPEGTPARDAAERVLPPEGSPERDAINKDLGGEGQPKKPEDGKDTKGGEQGAGEEEKAKAAQAMFDPKVDPAMAARLDKEKETLSQLANDSEKDGWEILDDKSSEVENIRDYTDEEYQNETGEYFENEFTRNTAPNAFKDEADMIQKMKEAKPVFLSAEEMQNIGNSDVGEILSASEEGGSDAMKERGKELADEYGKDWDRLEKGIASNSEVPPPMVLKDKTGKLHLLAGNTRLMSFTAYGKKLPVKVIDYDGEFNTEIQSDENQFKPIPAVDVKDEIPQADPDTFGGESDIPDSIEPKQLEQFNTDIQKVAQQVADAKAKGEPAPNINLCDVTVPGTNLYCDDNLGIPRSEMPQFKGTAQPGSRAAGMEADKSGEVDTEPVFREMLKQKGITTTQTEVPADKLKATQKDLVGAKVVGMMGALEENPEHEKITAPIYVSRDGYVIDGHHRWAAIVAYNAKNPDNQIPMKTTVLDMDIKDAIPMANKFAEDMGIAAKKADANKETPSTQPKTKLDPKKAIEKIKDGVKNWTVEEKEFFNKKVHKGNSPERRSFGQAVRDKAKGALEAIKHGAQHEVHLFKEAGSGVKNFFSGGKVSDAEKKALVDVAKKVALAAAFGAAGGGLAHGAAAFGKHVMVEFIPHVVAETIALGVGKAALFAGEEDADADMMKFIDIITKKLESADIPEDVMADAVDSYNENKENKMEQPEIKEELLPMVDAMIGSIIEGFIDEAAPKDWKLAAKSKETGRIVYFGSKEKKQAALQSGSHDDVDKNLKVKGVSDKKKEPVKGAGLFKGDTDYQKRMAKEKPAVKQTTEPATKPTKGGSLDTLLASIPDKGRVAVLKDKVNRSRTNIKNYFDKESKNKKNPYAAELKQVGTIMDKVFSGQKLNSTEKKMAARWIRVAEPTEANPDTSKYYIALEPNNFKKRVKEETGGRGASNAVFSAFRKYMEEAGLTQISTTTFGGKKTTANQTFVDENGKTKLLKLKDGKNIASVQKDSAGKVNSVKIGGLTITKLDTNEKGISEEERQMRMRNNRNINEYASKIEAGDMDFIDMDNGVVPDSPKNRVIVIQQALNGMAKRFKDLADKYYIADKETLGLIQKLSDFSKRDPNKNPQQWYAELQSTFSEIANHEGEPSLKEGWANFAEVYAAIVEMHDGGNGTQNGKCALLPQSTTLETVDVITIADGTNERKIVTLDGRSVKKGVGGASALTSKCNKSTYKNDKNGKIKEGIIKLSESHSPIYEMGFDQNMKTFGSYHKNYREDIINKAKGLGVSDNFIKNIQSRLSDPAKCPKPLPKGSSCGAAHESITEAIKTLKEKRGEKGLDVSDDTMAKLRMRLESYYYYTFLAHEAYNANVDVQDFSNDSILSQKGDSGGSALVKSRKIHINSSNGTSILAYPRPEFNVGFSLDGRSSNPGAGRFHNEEKRK